MIEVLCPNDSTLLGQVDSEDKVAEYLSHSICSVCGWSGRPQKTVLELLEEKAPDYISFGSQLWQKIRYKVWAVNVLAAQQGNALTTEQVIALVTSGLVIKELLQSGSLQVVQGVIQQMCQNNPAYNDIGAWAIAELKGYLGQ